MTEIYYPREGERKPTGHCQSQGECLRQGTNDCCCGPDTRGNSSHQAMSKYEQVHSWELMQFGSLRDTGQRANPSGKAHYPLQTVAVSCRPQLQQALPKHPSCGCPSLSPAWLIFSCFAVLFSYIAFPPCFWFCIVASLVFGIHCHLWICLLAWLLTSFLIPIFILFFFFFSLCKWVR